MHVWWSWITFSLGEFKTHCSLRKTLTFVYILGGCNYKHGRRQGLLSLITVTNLSASTNQTLNPPSHTWSSSRFLISVNGTTIQPVMQARHQSYTLPSAPNLPTKSYQRAPKHIHFSPFASHSHGPRYSKSLPLHLHLLPPTDSLSAAEMTFQKPNLIRSLPSNQNPSVFPPELSPEKCPLMAC